MRVVAIASQRGGAGKSTFAANLATLADRADAPSLLIDTDANGSLAAWHGARTGRTPLFTPCPAADIAEALDTARRNAGVEWVFIDSASETNDDVAAIIRLATLVVIPTRPGMFDLSEVPSTIALARRINRPFFVALNAVPSKRGATESPIVAAARRAIRDMGAPVWRGAVAERQAHVHALAAGQAVTEFEKSGPAAEEMRQLWRDVSDAANAMAQYQSSAEPSPDRGN